MIHSLKNKTLVSTREHLKTLTPNSVYSDLQFIHKEYGNSMTNTFCQIAKCQTVGTLTYVVDQSKQCAQICLPKNCMLPKFCNYQQYFFLNRLLKTGIFIKRTCISIFSKIEFVDQSKPCTQIYLHNIASCIYLQLPIAILKKNNSFRHASS